MREREQTETLQTVDSFLATQSTLALATVDGEGHPQVAPLYYVHDEGYHLYWLSSPESTHSINLSRRPHVAAAIYPEVWQWLEIRGLQIEGEAQAIHDEVRREAALQRYRQKYALPASFDAQIDASTLYVLKPTWIRWLDNGLRFGYKVEIAL